MLLSTSKINKYHTVIKSFFTKIIFKLNFITIYLIFYINYDCIKILKYSFFKRNSQFEK